MGYNDFLIPEIYFTAGSNLKHWTLKPYLVRMKFTCLPGVIVPFAGAALSCTFCLDQQCLCFSAVFFPVPDQHVCDFALALGN